MIHFDITKAGQSRHRSGLLRVSARLRDELKADARAIVWHTWDRRVGPEDWFLTAELFSEAELPGLSAWLARRPCRVAAIFHDAIPLKHPQITWPQSVERHPGYMRLLAEFDVVLAVSESSRQDLLGFWSWQRLRPRARVELLSLGADFNAQPRRAGFRDVSAKRALLCVGILEPRKNQELLLDACTALWARGARFDLHLVGRVNPHFGGPIRQRIRQLRARYAGLHYHGQVGDEELGRLYASCRAALFPTRAEGCGLPLLEAMWMGVPCVYSDLPVLRENAVGGGGLPVAVGDSEAWEESIARVLQEDALIEKLQREATERRLPLWSETANQIRQVLSGAGLGAPSRAGA